MTLNVRHSDRVTSGPPAPDAAAAVDAIIAFLMPAKCRSQSVSVSVAPARALGDNEIAGVCALPGVVLGTATHWRRSQRSGRAGQGLQEERAALARRRAAFGLTSRLSRATGGAAATIAQAHIGLLEDEDLNAAAAAEIARGRSAAKAWQVATDAAAAGLRQRTACGFASGSPISTMLPLRLRVRCPERLRVREWTLARGRSCLPTSCCHPN